MKTNFLILISIALCWTHYSCCRLSKLKIVDPLPPVERRIAFTWHDLSSLSELFYLTSGGSVNGIPIFCGFIPTTDPSRHNGILLRRDPVSLTWKYTKASCRTVPSHWANNGRAVPSAIDLENSLLFATISPEEWTVYPYSEPGFRRFGVFTDHERFVYEISGGRKKRKAPITSGFYEANISENLWQKIPVSCSSCTWNQFVFVRQPLFIGKKGLSIYAPDWSRNYISKDGGRKWLETSGFYQIVPAFASVSKNQRIFLAGSNGNFARMQILNADGHGIKTFPLKGSHLTFGLQSFDGETFLVVTSEEIALIKDDPPNFTVTTTALGEIIKNAAVAIYSEKDAVVYTTTQNSFSFYHTHDKGASWQKSDH